MVSGATAMVQMHVYRLKSCTKKGYFFPDDVEKTAVIGARWCEYFLDFTMANYKRSVLLKCQTCSREELVSGQELTDCQGLVQGGCLSVAMGIIR